MAYIFKQKLKIEDLVDLERQRYRVLIHEPEFYLSLLYQHYLEQHNFDIKHCPNLSEIKLQLRAFSPHIFIFNSDPIPGQQKPIFEVLPKLQKEFPSLKMISTGFSGHERVKDLLALGVLGHINRKFGRPEDLVTIVKSVLHN